MKVLFISRCSLPHIGGVEKHIDKLRIKFKNKNIEVDIVDELIINYPHIKLFGLLYIWFWMLINIRNLNRSDVIHCHDTFIWCLPLILLKTNSIICVTVHGLEWDKPERKISLFQKRLAVTESDRSIGIGHFLEKYIGKKFDIISYGAADVHNYKTPKEKNRIAYVGRLEENTGLSKFLKWLDKNSGYKVDFCGDGNLRKDCEKYGTVHGFCDPNPYYKKAELVVPGGYLVALEALNSGCDIKLFWNNKVKEDYWKMSPFYKLKGEELKKWARKQTWEKLANEYLELYREALNEKR